MQARQFFAERITRCLARLARWLAHCVLLSSLKVTFKVNLFNDDDDDDTFIKVSKL